MAISVKGNSTVSPMNYSIKSESQASAAYGESLKQAAGLVSPQHVDAAPPVRYANATVTDSAAVRQADAATKANAAYNSLAQSFGGMTTGYGSYAAGAAYGVEGSFFDTVI